MKNSKHNWGAKARRRGAIEKGYVNLNFLQGNVSVSRSKYKARSSPQETELQFEIACDNLKLEPEEVIKDMYSDERDKQDQKCQNKFGLTIIDKIKSWIYLWRSNKLDPEVIFYVRKEDDSKHSLISSYRDIFEDNGRTTCVIHSETNCYQFVRKKDSLVLVHCASEITDNIVTNSNVKVSAFDFEDSSSVAQSAASFVGFSLGYQSGGYNIKDSREFFERFYKKLVQGVPPQRAYDKTVSHIQFTPNNFVHMTGCLDSPIFSVIKNGERKYV